jgi:WD40 repeat protein/3',5'-cyclic AMP phosphodiesterase CpdA
MADQPNSGLAVRVLDANGNTAGVGVLVGQREILTCAHVVNVALGRDRRAQDQPAGEDVVEFAVGDGPPLRARVQRWLPPPRTGAIGDDIAGLVVTNTELPPGLVPARLAVNPPARGRVVDVFGYPGDPPRPQGGWVAATVRGQIGGRHLQLDSHPDNALRIQPGFSGSPVYDRSTSRVVGLLTTAPPAASGARDSYAITADRLRLAWPEVLDPRRGPVSGWVAHGGSELVVLHVSDLQFGRNHLFGGNGLIPADQAHDILFRRLHEDLDRLAEDPGLRPDLMVVTGDLAEWGLPSEFDQVVEFLTALTEAVQLPRQHVAIVPGNHDVNRDDCAAYFLEQRAAEREPVAPYWRKWKHFAAAFKQFYEGVDGVSFTPDEPWTLFEMPDLAVVVAGLNSTMAESHRAADHYGWVGEHQLRWFAERLAGYGDQGWLRLAAVHHNAVRGAVASDENLRDAEHLDQWLGQRGLVNLLLHGHTHDGRVHPLSSDLLVLSTGSAAVTAEARPQEVPNQYQLLNVRPSGVTRHARRYSAGQRCWIGDTRVSSDGSHHIDATFPAAQPEVPEPQHPGPSPDDCFERVLEATRVRYPEATVTPRREAGYLRVSNPVPDEGVEQWPVGVVDGEVAGPELAAFVRVHRQFACDDPSVPSELVYCGPPATEDMVHQARRQGVRLRSIISYQRLVDMEPLLARQDQRLAADRIYPTELYVPQRYRLLLDDDPGATARDDLLAPVIEWLAEDGPRFIMVLGDFGRGKTFLLRELARGLRLHLRGLLPVLVELRSLEKAPSAIELLAQHLVREGVNPLDIKKLQYMIRRGRLALLIDGFDELELRIGYDNAADYLNILLRAVQGDAKVVLTSRTQHFRSTAQIRTALGDQVAALGGNSRVAVLEGFTQEQILQFLVNYYRGNRVAARARSALIADVRDLLGLSSNPRMLSFIAELDEQRLHAIQAEHGQLSAAELYRELVDFWLLREAGRHQHRGGLRSLDEKDRLAACTALALRLWATTASTIPLAEFTTEVAATLTRLAERRYTADQAAHTVGVGTLLVRTDKGEGEFMFVHQSVMDWLVANSAAERLRNGQEADTLQNRKMSPLMLDFLCDLAGHEVARRWAAGVVADPAASMMAKQNGLAVTTRLGPGPRQELAGVDLRDQDLTNRDFQNANLQGAVLRDMRLVGTNFAGADLRGADLTGVRMVGGDLSGAQIAGSRWNRAALLGVSGLDDLITAPELAVAAVAGRDPTDVMIAPTGEVSSVVFCPDATLLALSRGPSVEIVDVASGHPLRALSGHTGEVTGVAFSSDGALLATASNDGTARLWDPTTGNSLRVLSGHTGWVRGVTFSSDGALLATASNDGTARLWDPTTGNSLRVLSGHTGWVRGVTFSSDGALLATASNDGTARLWDPTTGNSLRVLSGHTGEVTGVAFSPDNTLLATASTDHTARLWDPATAQPRTTLQDHTGWVRAVAFSLDGTLLATASDDHTARLWDPATGHSLRVLSGHTDWVTGVAFSSDSILLATASDDGTARLWDPATGQHQITVTGHTSPMWGVAFSPDGTRLATASDDGTARLWDPATGQHRTLTGHTDWATGVVFSPDGTRLATASDDGTARLWDPATGQHRTLTGHTGWVRGVAFSPDGALLATTSTDGTARLWDLTNGQRRAHALTGHPSPVWGVAFSPDGALLATASDDRTIRLWDLTPGWHGFLRRYQTLTGHTGWVRGVAFSPDGARLATASADHTARLWDPATGQHQITVTGHTGWVRGVAFSPDGALLATASDDGTARLWDPATGYPLRVLSGHTGRVRGVAFSPDGALLATTSTDGTARLWDPANGALRATLLALKAGGYAVILPEGSYKLAGDPGRSLWWAIKLCRFASGELDPYDTATRRLSADDPIRR